MTSTLYIIAFKDLQLPSPAIYKPTCAANTIVCPLMLLILKQREYSTCVLLYVVTNTPSCLTVLNPIVVHAEYNQCFDVPLQ